MGVFKDKRNFYDYSISDILGQNLKELFIFGLIEKGAFTVAEFANPNTSGMTLLQRSFDESLGGEGRIYEGLGPSWIWQTLVSVPSGFVQPFQVSGVYIDKVFHPISESGIFAHIVDYRKGRIIFDNAISGTPLVEAEYAFNDIGIYLTDEPQWKLIIDEYFEEHNKLESLQPSGLAVDIKENRLWLPSLFIEVKERPNARGLQLGGGDISEFSIWYHIFTEKAFVRNRLLDILNDQFRKRIVLYDINNAPFSFNFDGSLASGALEYPQLATTTSPEFITFARVESSRGGPVDNLFDIFRGQVRSIIEIDRYSASC